ncbi:uncharacterized protein LOC122325151 isoform X2 [Puntigrus tetrazona]|uniref:uncharacterized protein LOC122325151 isoform X2 n=1 Tax=Puntigrus tetrazona TaxID=1606681 RepID=UPI001C890263|nr:uncharacterized protein LOC122325151 isoform X2 [Puntigrus tetrazona]
MFFRGFGLRPPPPSLIKRRSVSFSGQLNSLRPSVAMYSKDAQESLESGGGGGARCRCSNGRRSANAVLLIQSLLTVACAAFSLNIFLNQQQKEKGIFMQMHELDSDELKFFAIWNQEVDLNNEKRVKLTCSGPYMVYLWACFDSFNAEPVANLTMEQGNKVFHLQTLQDGECHEMQSVFMLSDKSEVTLKVNDAKDSFKIKLFLGLHYMLGAQCFTYPL